MRIKTQTIYGNPFIMEVNDVVLVNNEIFQGDPISGTKKGLSGFAIEEKIDIGPAKEISKYIANTISTNTLFESPFDDDEDEDDNENPYEEEEEEEEEDNNEEDIDIPPANDKEEDNNIEEPEEPEEEEEEEEEKENDEGEGNEEERQGEEDANNNPGENDQGGESQDPSNSEDGEDGERKDAGEKHSNKSKKTKNKLVQGILDVIEKHKQTQEKISTEQWNTILSGTSWTVKASLVNESNKVKKRHPKSYKNILEVKKITAI